jgi:hypothetical protein
MQLVVDIIAHTPSFVWVVLIIMMWRMRRAMRQRWVSLTGLMAQAAIFLLLGVAGVTLRSSTDATGWALVAIVCFPVGFFTAPHPISIDHAKRSVLLPGSIILPLRLGVIFAVRYGLAVLTALHPDRRAELTLATSLFSGAVFGYYAGWTAFLFRAYWRHAETVKAPVASA